jgi:hypothetical protein
MNDAPEQRPYPCPGCKADLPAGTAAVEHMAACTRLQAMIAVGRAKHKAECKKDEEARSVKFRQRLERDGNYFAPAQVH